MLKIVVYSAMPLFNLPLVGKHIERVAVMATALPLISLLLCYCLSAWQDHSMWYWPYLSDITTCSPERCINALFMNSTSLCTFLMMYIRYRLVDIARFRVRLLRRKLLHHINTAAFAVGCFQAFAVSVSANFPRFSGQPPIYSLLGYRVFESVTTYWSLQLVIDMCFRFKCAFEPSETHNRLLWLAALVVSLLSSLVCSNQVSDEFWQEVSYAYYTCDATVIDKSWYGDASSRRYYAASGLLQMISCILLAYQQVSFSRLYRHVSSSFRPGLVYPSMAGKLKSYSEHQLLLEEVETVCERCEFNII